MSWSPFVGIFIARICRGRSIREFVLAVLLVPSLVGNLWFSAFRLTGIEVAQLAPHIFDTLPETQLFGVLNELPLSFLLSIFTVVLIASFFITSGESAIFVLGMQTAFGTLKSCRVYKSDMGIALSAIAFILLLARGETGLNALQSETIISALPFSVIVILMAISLYKDANYEKK